MKWTNEPPTETGWYFYCEMLGPLALRCVMEVSKHDLPIKSEPNIYWQGPIEVPPPPVVEDEQTDGVTVYDYSEDKP